MTPWGLSEKILKRLMFRWNLSSVRAAAYLLFFPSVSTSVLHQTIFWTLCNRSVCQQPNCRAFLQEFTECLKIFFEICLYTFFIRYFWYIDILQVRIRNQRCFWPVQGVTCVLDNDNCQFVIIINFCYESQRGGLV